jgi:hypothetical protein
MVFLTHNKFEGKFYLEQFDIDDDKISTLKLFESKSLLSYKVESCPHKNFVVIMFITAELD